MVAAYKYELDKSSRKFICPGCGKKRLVRFIDTETGEYLPSVYGRCDRESKCGYFLNPYEEGYNKDRSWGNLNFTFYRNRQFLRAPHHKKGLTYIPYGILKKTLRPKAYSKNTFVQNFLTNVPFPFPVERVTKVIELYRLGTIPRGGCCGMVTFPFIDRNGKIRAVQAKQFGRDNHTLKTTWLHSILKYNLEMRNEPLPRWLTDYLKQDKKITCLFGEHLLNKFPENPIGLVEAPKTAIYGTLYFGFPETPDKLLWLAVYNKSSFSFEKLKALKDRDVYVFPDLSKDGSTFEEWKAKAEKIEDKINVRFTFSDLLERAAPGEGRAKGYDIADFLIKQDWKDFTPDAEKKMHPSEPEKVNRMPPSIEGDGRAPFSDPETGSSLLQGLQKKGKVFIPDVEKGSQLSKPEKVNPILHPIGEDEDPPFSDPEIDPYLLPYLQKRGNTHTPGGWDKKIKELKEFFSHTVLPDPPLQLTAWGKITNIRRFIDSHLAIITANNGREVFKPYLDRLDKLKLKLKQ